MATGGGVPNLELLTHQGIMGGGADITERNYLQLLP